MQIKSAMMFVSFLPIIVASLFMGVTLSVSAAEPTLKQIARPGEHPRLLFTNADLPEIRARAETPEGRRLADTMRHTAFGAHDAAMKAMAANDAAWIKARAADSLVQWSYYDKKVAMAGVLYQMTGDAEIGKGAADLFRIWLDAATPDDLLKPEASWGRGEKAIAYDCVFELLTAEERDRARRLFAAMLGAPTLAMADNEWWLGGPCMNGRSTGNWTPMWCGNIILTLLAIEGETEVDAGILPKAIFFLRRALNDSIATDGGMYEGVTYPTGFGTKEIPLAVHALRMRGLDMTRDTHLDRAAQWFSYEMLPWGYEGQAVNKADGNLNAGAFISFLGMEFGGLSDWVAAHAIGDIPGQRLYDYIYHAITGFPEPRPVRPVDLPLSHWFSTVGRVICRSGWQPRDAHLLFNTTPIGAGHTHADQGSFCFASHDVNFIVDSSSTAFASEEHNLVHIDGKGQAQREGGTEGFIRSTEFSDYADIMDADTKLAYNRVLQGPLSGPWHWQEFNPVQRADRRVLFVRGITGPVLAVADDIRKDSEVRRYEWLARTGVNNELTTQGRRFRIRERFGGAYLESRGEGQKVTLEASDVPDGVYRGWLLVRGLPYPRRWSSTHVNVNGRRIPDVTMAIKLGEFGQGWFWHPLLPNGPKAKPEMELSGGKLSVTLEGVTGVHIALALFTRDTEWEPGFEIPPSGGDTFILGAETAQQGDNPWTVHEDPRSELLGVFLGVQTPELDVQASKLTGLPVLHAVVEDTQARFLAVMAPHDCDDDREVRPFDKNTVIVQSPAGRDIVGGRCSNKHLRTDAEIASVSYSESPYGYAMVSGTALRTGTHTLIKADAPVHVVNDGTRLVVRGPDGATVSCRRLGATTLVCNGTESPLKMLETVTVTIPRLPTEWKVEISPDGRTAHVTGSGQLPLHFQAPGVVDVTVNGISRYFVRDRADEIWPFLANGFDCFTYAGGMTARVLRGKVRDGSVSVVRTDWDSAPLLRLDDGHAVMSLKTAGPGRYTASWRYAPAGNEKVIVRLDDRELVLSTPEGADGVLRHEVGDVDIHGSRLAFSLEAEKPCFLKDIVLTPHKDFIAPDRWSIIGPFASAWKPGGSPEQVGDALRRVFPPEERVDLDAACAGAGGADLKWRPCQPAEEIQHDFDRGVTFRQLGVKSGTICYAATFIASPNDRHARLWILSDWWGKAWINGRPVRSPRSRGDVARDGSEVHSGALTPLDITLREGENVLLVKNHGGNGGNRFVAYITNPGDLTLSPTPLDGVEPFGTIAEQQVDLNN